MLRDGVTPSVHPEALEGLSTNGSRLILNLMAVPLRPYLENYSEVTPLSRLTSIMRTSLANLFNTPLT
jgi:hypothetical protein